MSGVEIGLCIMVGLVSYLLAEFCSRRMDRTERVNSGAAKGGRK